jgi:CheY-like chemotaxis protein
MTTILVVDDERSIVETLSEILTWEGYEVRTADNGQEALDALAGPTASALPDLVLVDYMMPVLDGIATLESIQLLPGCKGLPAVLMSAVAEPPPPTDRLWRGFLRKPFGVDELLETIEKALAQAVGRRP